MDIAKAKEEFANGGFRGPKHIRLLLAEVEKLQGQVRTLESRQQPAYEPTLGDQIAECVDSFTWLEHDDRADLKDMLCRMADEAAEPSKC